MSPHLSVIICTRNRPDKITSAVESVVANDCPSFEVTAIDQSSTSETGGVRDPIMAVDPGPRYHFSEQA